MKEASSIYIAPAMTSPEMVKARAPKAVLDAVDYYKKSRSEMLAFSPPGSTRLIDIGCGEGLFGQAVNARFLGCETWGIEPVAAAAKKRPRHVTTASFKHRWKMCPYFRPLISTL
jgi:tRNA1(Val) A37 N6-methylase TrmN6